MIGSSSYRFGFQASDPAAVVLPQVLIKSILPGFMSARLLQAHFTPRSSR
jgi:hypothetical protein